MTEPVTYPAKPANMELILDLIQDAAGGRVPTYDGIFVDPLIDINLDPLARTSQRFRSDGVNWLRTAWSA